MKRLLLRLLLPLACLWLVGALPTPARAAPTGEYQVKAVFLFHFLQFVEWPPEAQLATEAPIRIGVLGNDPFGAALDAAVRGETVRQHPLLVERSQRLDDLRDCQLLFISRSERGRLPEILAGLGTAPILTVSETEGFAERGGAINFYVEGAKVRFEINPTAARAQGLRLSSQLLGLGRLVGPVASGSATERAVSAP